MKMRVLARLLKRRYFTDHYAEQVAVDYARMQDPEYAKLAHEAEKALPGKPSSRGFSASHGSFTCRSCGTAVFLRGTGPTPTELQYCLSCEPRTAPAG